MIVAVAGLFELFHPSPELGHLSEFVVEIDDLSIADQPCQ